FAIVFITYYLRQVVRKPAFFCTDGKFRWFLLANVDKIQDKYWPPIWAIQTHVQTALANYLRGRLPDLPYRRENIFTSDGGLVSLDWYDPVVTTGQQRPTAEPVASGSSNRCHNAVYDDESLKPIALFLPGLTGDSQTEYIKSKVPVAHELGYRSVVFNNRGRGNMKLLTPRFYCAANYEDLKLVLEYLRHRNPDAKIVATGISLGGIVLGRYLIDYGDAALVDAALLISVCWDFLAGAECLEKPGLNLKLNHHLARSLCGIIEENRHVFESVPKINLDEVLKSKTLREFDHNFTVKMWGFKSVKDYYSQSSHKGKLCCIKRPTLCVNAADDMFAPVCALPVDEVEESSHVAMIVTSRGGHIGFMEGFLPILPFFTETLLHQYLRSLYKLKDIKRDLIY
ncbi:unnamed protein product, partial [Oppiella nova]